MQVALIMAACLSGRGLGCPSEVLRVNIAGSRQFLPPHVLLFEDFDVLVAGKQSGRQEAGMSGHAPLRFLACAYCWCLSLQQVNWLRLAPQCVQRAPKLRSQCRAVTAHLPRPQHFTLSSSLATGAVHSWSGIESCLAGSWGQGGRPSPGRQ